MQLRSTLNPKNVRITVALGTYVQEHHYPRSSNSPVYSWYNAYFDGLKNRYYAIAKAFDCEYDNQETDFYFEGKLVRPPQLWVRIVRHPTLGLRVIPVWRGSLGNIACDTRGFIIAETDDVIDYHVNNMSKAKGVNLFEVSVWMDKLERAKALHVENPFPNPNDAGKSVH